MANEIKKEILKIKDKIPHARGRAELIKFAKGHKLTRKESILAQCVHCSGYFLSGIHDCMNYDCPLYPFNPYAYTGRGQNEDNEHDH